MKKILLAFMLMSSIAFSKTTYKAGKYIKVKILSVKSTTTVDDINDILNKELGDKLILKIDFISGKTGDITKVVVVYEEI